MMNNNTAVRIVRVAVTTGKANKWVATDNVFETELERYKEDITAMLHRTGTKPTTKITFNKYFVEEWEYVENGGTSFNVWGYGRFTAKDFGKEVWRNNFGEEF
jgi:hypothetical protein